MKIRFLIWLLLFASAEVKSAFFPADSVLRPRPVFGRQAKVVAQLLENYHYRKLRINDSLSSAILDSYIQALDIGKMYFRQSDIQSFEKYRYQLDDLIFQENVHAAFDIYQVYLKRFHERMDYVMNVLLKTPFEFSSHEFYEPNREKAPWPASAEEQNKIWKLYIKNQALSLKLTGKSQEEIQETREALKTGSEEQVEEEIGDLLFSLVNLARHHGVAVVEHKFVARTLYKLVDVGKEIPTDLYRAVAEILAFVYRARGVTPGQA